MTPHSLSLPPPPLPPSLIHRELAYQIADQFKVFGRHIGLRDAVIVGGVGELISSEFHRCTLTSNDLWPYRYDEARFVVVTETSRRHSNTRSSRRPP